MLGAMATLDERRHLSPLICAGGGALLLALERVSDQPDRWRPQADEQRSALGVTALVLIDGLGADPQNDAQSDGTEREALHVPGPKADCVEALGQHYVSSTAAQADRLTVPALLDP